VPLLWLLFLLFPRSGTLWKQMEFQLDKIDWCVCVYVCVRVVGQKEYYRCGYECFNRSKGEIQRCVERCAAPVQRAGAILDSELNKFQATTMTLFLFKTLPCASKLSSSSSSSSSQKLHFFCSSTGFHSCTSSCTLWFGVKNWALILSCSSIMVSNGF
jgi:hypothetical protein